MSRSGVLSRGIIRAMAFFVLLSMSVTFGWAFDDDPGQRTLSGKVTDIDSIKSMITVSYPDPVSGYETEVDIMVPEGARIMNGTEAGSFLDIEPFDPVTVTYYDDSEGVPRAKEILELNPATR